MTEPVKMFSLVDQPWILVQRHDGTVDELSLLGVFQQASQVRRVMGELPTQGFAIVRLLLAILHRATPERIDVARWGKLWHADGLPVDEIAAYLAEWADRFDLLHPTTPFYQVADLHTSKGEFTELVRLIGDAPVGSPFLTTRLGVELESLSFAEAARWLVHCQAFDVSGIKTGAVGDPRVRGGKGYPIGMGSAGYLGGIVLEGDDLTQTLLLNFVPHDSEILTHVSTDLAAWEREPFYTAAPLRPENGDDPYRPEGMVEVLTWQSRRIRLVSDEHRVRQVLICNGDRFSPVNLQRVEAMTAWRRSPAQEKKLALPEVYLPRAHDPERALWRGLGALLSEPPDRRSQPPATVRWVARLSGAQLPATFVARTRAIGIDYITQSATVGEIIDDEIDLPVQLLQAEHEDLRATVLLAVENADRAVLAYAQLCANLERAAGGDGGGETRDAARAEAFYELEPLFRRWILQLASPDVSAPAANDAWATVARRALFRLGTRAVEASGPAAWTGREFDGKGLNSALAERWFLTSLYSIFPDFTGPKDAA